MTAVEISLIIIGLIFIVVSFFLQEKLSKKDKKVIVGNKSLIEKKIDMYTKNSGRVLIFAYGKDKDNLTFLGFVNIKDELRDEAKEGIKLIKSASKVVFDCASCISAVREYPELDEVEKEKLVFFVDLIDEKTISKLNISKMQFIFGRNE